MEIGDPFPKEGQLELERYKAGEATILELLRAAIEFERAALRPLPLLNGGAIVATLTFAGHFWATASRPLDLSLLIWALLSWAIGLVLYTGAVFFGYLSQHKFLKASRRQREVDEARRAGNNDQQTKSQRQHGVSNSAGERWRKFAYASAIGSLLAFIVGAGAAIYSLVPGANVAVRPSVLTASSIYAIELGFNIVGTILLTCLAFSISDSIDTSSPNVTSSNENRLVDAQERRWYRYALPAGIVFLLIGFALQFYVALRSAIT